MQKKSRKKQKCFFFENLLKFSRKKQKKAEIPTAGSQGYSSNYKEFSLYFSINLIDYFDFYYQTLLCFEEFPLLQAKHSPKELSSILLHLSRSYFYYEKFLTGLVISLLHFPSKHCQ